MERSLFSSCMDRTRTNRLEHEVKLLMRDMLGAYGNSGYQVHDAFINAGHHIYARQYGSPTSIHAYRDILIAEADRLTYRARKHDGAWLVEPTAQSDEEITAAREKEVATDDVIEVEVIALATRLEDQGYEPLEIGRALGTVALMRAPFHLLAFFSDHLKRIEEGRAERRRAFLRQHLGEDWSTLGRDNGR